MYIWTIHPSSSSISSKNPYYNLRRNCNTRSNVSHALDLKKVSVKSITYYSQNLASPASTHAISFSDHAFILNNCHGRCTHFLRTSSTPSNLTCSPNYNNNNEDQRSSNERKFSSLRRNVSTSFLYIKESKYR